MNQYDTFVIVKDKSGKNKDFYLFLFFIFAIEWKQRNQMAVGVAFWPGLGNRHLEATWLASLAPWPHLLFASWLQLSASLFSLQLWFDLSKVDWRWLKVNRPCCLPRFKCLKALLSSFVTFVFYRDTRERQNVHLYLFHLFVNQFYSSGAIQSAKGHEDF